MFNNGSVRLDFYGKIVRTAEIPQFFRFRRERFLSLDGFPGTESSVIRNGVIHIIASCIKYTRYIVLCQSASRRDS